MTNQPDAGATTGKVLCSWSGGKDSTLALHRARATHGEAEMLLTMMIEDGSRSRSHGLRREVIDAQARAMGRDVRLVPASWSGYEASFKSSLDQLAAEGFRIGVYGDIDIAEHRAWVERVSAAAGIEAVEPLWQDDRRALLEEFFGLGFRARIVALEAKSLPRRMLGEELTLELALEIEACGADLAGENGEYHTVVFDGPLFSEPIPLAPGREVERDGYWFIDFSVCEPA